MPLLHSFCTFGFHIYPKCCGVPLKISQFFSPYLYSCLWNCSLPNAKVQSISNLHDMAHSKRTLFQDFFLCFMSWKMPHIEYLREMGKHNLEIRKKSLSNVKKKCPKSLKQNLNGLRYIRIFCTQVNKES